MHVPIAAEATGRCLSASLDIAVEAQRCLQLDVRLVRWRIKGDLDYIDHWAVALGDTHVIDPTRSQVDGRRDLVCELCDYPANFCDRRTYLASTLLAGSDYSDTPHSERLSNHFVWSCAKRMMSIDLRRAWMTRDPLSAVNALRDHWRFVRCFAFGALTRALERRANELLDRLHRRSDISVRRGSAQTATDCGAKARKRFG